MVKAAGIVLLATLCLAFCCSISAPALANIDEPTTGDAKLGFSAAPPEVQSGLLEIFAECGTSPDIVKKTAQLEAGPFGGAGRRDFIFSFSTEGWPRKWNGREYPNGGRCTANATWFVMWMSLPGNHYKELIMVGDRLVSNGHRYILFDVGCGKTEWDSEGSFKVWNSKKAGFVSISKCMTIDQALSWMKAHSYQ